MPRILDKNNVILLRINESDLNSFLIDTDIDDGGIRKYMLEEFSLRKSRHWFQFTVPKVFRVVDSLQRYVCERHGKKSGSYSYFVQQLENDFLQENLSILLEYGLPCSSVQKLTRFLSEDLSEDEVLVYIIKIIS